MRGTAAKARELDKVASLVAISVIMVHEYLRGILLPLLGQGRASGQAQEACSG